MRVDFGGWRGRSPRCQFAVELSWNSAFHFEFLRRVEGHAMNRLARLFGEEENSVLQIDGGLPLLVVGMARNETEFAVDAYGGNAVRERRMLFAAVMRTANGPTRRTHQPSVPIAVKNVSVVEAGRIEEGAVPGAFSFCLLLQNQQPPQILGSIRDVCFGKPAIQAADAIMRFVNFHGGGKSLIRRTGRRRILRQLHRGALLNRFRSFWFPTSAVRRALEKGAVLIEFRQFGNRGRQSGGFQGGGG